MKGWTIKREDAILVCIDFQEKLLAGIYGREKFEECASRLIKGCRMLGIPILVTQQYTKGLGPTSEKITRALVEAIPEVLPEASFTPFEKTTFSAMKEPSFAEAIAGSNKKTVIIAGSETHICVQQTAIELIEAGYGVFGAVDCMASRTLENKEFGQIRMTQAGVAITGYESVLFDMLLDAKDENFKNISRLVR